jgi:hypothetical protein
MIKLFDKGKNFIFFFVLKKIKKNDDLFVNIKQIIFIIKNLKNSKSQLVSALKPSSGEI